MHRSPPGDTGHCPQHARHDHRPPRPTHVRAVLSQADAGAHDAADDHDRIREASQHSDRCAAMPSRRTPPRSTWRSRTRCDRTWCGRTVERDPRVLGHRSPPSRTISPTADSGQDPRRLIWPLIWPFTPPRAAYRSRRRSLVNRGGSATERENLPSSDRNHDQTEPEQWVAQNPKDPVRGTFECRYVAPDEGQGGADRRENADQRGAQQCAHATTGGAAAPRPRRSS